MADPHDRLRREVRAFVAAAGIAARNDSWLRGYDPDFTRELGRRGWIGMTWPTEYGGGGRSNTERFVVTEELLRAGAPVTAHWTADRQIGPTILRVGTEDQRAEILPKICRGEVVVGLGLSETEAGSDLAAVRTRATPIDGGWSITGAKVWTTSAHHATHLYILARTGEGASKHEGLTEFLVDADTPGITVRPILDLVGEHHFNEVILDDVHVPDDRVLGTVGAGWKQVTEQLAFERGGVERYLSTYPVLAAMIRTVARHPDRAATERLGELAARLTALRQLGLQLADALDQGEAPVRLAAGLKLAGTRFEKDVVETARYVFDVCEGDAEAHRLLVDGLAVVPGASIRGGSSEVLYTVISRAELPR
ncbi:acyl-CoA dehydrogenase family protein [Frankia sp. QA3]|uniref:acyl-CoA dehydrogenase family protein n=1 Tax=Frankia sp. QA3 TaxID=710111 RepID=UPI000269BF45|nr:acyl-CoA dehydrogenase family protein [Frankia sp. QA3]EIV91935.1 acyl-CoA dehydrogenase [Frankia sp. QA3]